jgi:two-component system chemotaxis sensor kinase CheA
MQDNSEFIAEFLVESAENLDALDRDLLALERTPDDPPLVAGVFRSIHTIKGNSGFFGFSKLGGLAHAGEHLLGRIRDRVLPFDAATSAPLYALVDAVRTILASIRDTGTEGDHDFRDLSRALAAAAEAAPRPLPPQSEPPTAPLTAPPQPEPISASLPLPRGEGWGEGAETPATITSPIVRPAADASPAERLPAATPLPPAGTPPPAPPADTTIRVDVAVLASILDLVGELVLARNELRAVDTEDPAVLTAAQRIHAVTTALQEAAVKTRLQPVDHVLGKFPRTVRDLAVACGKEVRLVIDGADTELDRSLVEAIRDPLTHLVRNAVDHGIEPPADREAAGKPREGRLSLRAFQESGRVTIEVTDDGGGIPVEAVRAKAVARGLVSAEAAAALSDHDVLQFIFEPGFSTAAQVTSVSGRGVGMDVVRTNIEAIGGTVDLDSRPGVGTTVRVRVPLTLAIVPALVVRCAGERFAIPQAAVHELVRLRTGPDGPRVEGLPEAPVLRVRGRLVPLVFLDCFLGLRPETACRDDGTVVLVRVDDHEYGLVIDGLRADDTAGRGDLVDAASLTTIVVKPIGAVLAQLGVYSGATVLGDGGVVLILDLRGILRISRLPPSRPMADAPRSADAAIADRYLVCTTRGGRRIALQLADVTRLERHPRADLESLGPRTVVRRGDGFTPVVDADLVLGAPVGPAVEPARLVVLGVGGEAIAVEVGGIVDVLPAETPPDLTTGNAGPLALGGRAAERIDRVAARRFADA